MNSTLFVGSSELQQSPGDVLRKVLDSGETCYITDNGKAKAVLMDINRYHALMDLIEESESLQKPSEIRHQVSVRSLLKPSSRE